MDARETGLGWGDRLPLHAGVAQLVEHQPSNVTEGRALTTREWPKTRMVVRKTASVAYSAERAETVRNSRVVARMAAG